MGMCLDEGGDTNLQLAVHLRGGRREAKRQDAVVGVIEW
jgi:hypothetical protein